MQCGAGQCGSGSRRFLTLEERIKLLEEYKSNLEKETEGVKERIDELKRER